MFSRQGALYIGWQAVTGEVRLRRDRLSVVSHERERSVGTIEQDYLFDDVAAVSLTPRSWRRPQRTLRLDMLDGSVEHVWVAEAVDSFEQLEAAFSAHRERHPAPTGVAPPSRSANTWDEQLGRGEHPMVSLATLVVMAVGLVLLVAADAPAVRLAAVVLVIGPNAVTLVRRLRRERRRRLLDSAG